MIFHSVSADEYGLVDDSCTVTALFPAVSADIVQVSERNCGIAFLM